MSLRANVIGSRSIRSQGIPCRDANHRYGAAHLAASGFAASVTAILAGSFSWQRPVPGKDRCRARCRVAVRSDADAEARQEYECTWSNPRGKVLTPLVDSLWAAERPFVWNGIDVGGKMAVVRLPSGGLWVHSPVHLDDALRTALTTLGPVLHIVSPNFEHVKWARQWREAFPSATLWGSPGMKEKFPDIPYDFELDKSGAVPEQWEGAFDAVFFDCESIPFTDIPFFNEVVFHHRASRTLICTDTFWNYPTEGIPRATALWKWGMDEIYLPIYKGLMVRDAAALERALARVAAWDPAALLPCHGAYLSSGAAAAFLQHFER